MQPAHSIGDITLPVAARPTRQSHQPAYLRDYEVQLVGRRPPAQSDVAKAAQYAQGQEDRYQEMREDGAKRKAPSHSVSPISQLDYALIDEWPAAHAADNLPHPVKPKAQMGMPPGLDHRPARPLVGPDMLRAHADAYSRPSEAVHREQLVQSPFAGSIASFHQLSLDAQASAPNPHLQQRAASAFQPIPQKASTPGPRANSAPLPLSQPPHGHPAYHPPVAPAVPPSSPADTREQFLMDTITRMMSELQAIKDVSRPAMPSYQPAPAQSLSQPPYDSDLPSVAHHST